MNTNQAGEVQMATLLGGGIVLNEGGTPPAPVASNLAFCAANEASG
jgi:hypothetical protein